MKERRQKLKKKKWDSKNKKNKDRRYFHPGNEGRNKRQKKKNMGDKSK